jgi:hypothetical protein
MNPWPEYNLGVSYLMSLYSWESLVINQGMEAIILTENDEVAKFAIKFSTSW